MAKEIIPITSQQHFNDMLSTNPYVVVDFYATWCPPCKMLSFVLEQMVSDKSLGEHTVILKVNTDELTDLASFYQVRSLPTVVLFEHNREVNRFVGFKPQHEFKKIVKQSFDSQALIP